MTKAKAHTIVAALVDLGYTVNAVVSSTDPEEEWTVTTSNAATGTNFGTNAADAANFATANGVTAMVSVVKLF